uniref:Uncharacterized protein n=1 Tax=Magallana gigas TaxID=29159 RepID=A0A8W8JLN2_MAGGI
MDKASNADKWSDRMSISGLPVGEKEKPDESSASNSTVSSGIGSGASLKSTELDAMSVGSGTVGLGKVLSLSLKGEWMLLEQVLRTLDKGNPDVSQREEENGLSPLMVAVRENKLVIAERLLDLGANINDRANDGRTPLHFAATFAKDDVVKLLLNRKADQTIPGGPRDQIPLHMASARQSGALSIVQILLKGSSKDLRLTQDKNGCIPLFLAAEAGNTSVCKELLSQCSESQLLQQRKENGDSALHIACRRRDIDMARMLIEAGSPVDLRNEEGHTPLHIAAWEGDEVMVKYLYQMKANPNFTDKMDRVPVHIAAERGHSAIVDLLVDKCKASISARTKDGSTLMHIASQYGHPDTALTFLKKGVPLHMPNKSGAICLHTAAMRGHTNVVRALLSKGASVDAKTKDGYTALHLAVECGKPQVVQMLLGYGAQVEFKGGKAGETPLHIAARTRDGERCAEMLMKSGADVNAVRENGETAMHIAARNGQLKMLQALMEEGGDPTQQSKNGETPLHVAVRHCHLAVAKELLTYVSMTSSRIDAVMLVNQQNWEGETPVHYAAELVKSMTHFEFEDTDIMRLLLQYDGDKNIQTKLTHETSLHYCARAGNEDILLEIVKHIGNTCVQNAVNKQSKNGWSPLLVASEQGHLQIVKILLQYHARVDVFDEYHGKAALHLAAENGHEQVADVLLWHKAFVNAKSKLGLTPLHLAAQNGYNDLVRLLIETHNAVIDALSLAKQTPLHMAAQCGKMEVCNTLMKMRADANATDVHGQTPLHLAAENDHSDVVKLFLKHRPELVSMANTNGMTCAHIAADKGSVAVIRELMKFNRSVVTTARNRTNNSTALHLAAAGGHKEVVEVLLKAGASATDENADGMTAIHLCARYGHVNILDALDGHVNWRITSKKTGLSAIHCAAHYGQVDFVREMLTKVPATVKSEHPGGGDSCPVDTASILPRSLVTKGLVRLLLLNSPGVQADVSTELTESGASPKFETKEGKVSICFAAAANHSDVLSFLMKRDHNTNHLMDDKKFVFDLMVCGKNSRNKCIEEFILLSPAPVDTAAKTLKQFRILAVREKERSRDLTSAGDYCENMATELRHCCQRQQCGSHSEGRRL